MSSPHGFWKTKQPSKQRFLQQVSHEIFPDTGYHQPNCYQTYSSFLIMGCSRKRTDRLMCHYLSDTISFTSQQLSPSLVPGCSLKESEKEIKGKVNNKMLPDAAFLYPLLGSGFQLIRDWLDFYDDEIRFIWISLSLENITFLLITVLCTVPAVPPLTLPFQSVPDPVSSVCSLLQQMLLILQENPMSRNMKNCQYFQVMES